MEQEELSSGMFGDALYEAAKPLRKEFEAWHRPRKQFVRNYQWTEQIERLLNEGGDDERTIKYLGLPGVDLLDIRFFHDHLCLPKNANMKFLGFVSGTKENEQTELNISLDEVRKLSNIDALSDIISDDFCLLADQSTIAWSSAQRFGPFDVINLDLCDGFGSHPPGDSKSHYTALNSLMALQSKCTRPWLLFLTTRTGEQDIHKEVLERLIEKYSHNLRDSDAFRGKSGEILGITDDDTLQEVSITPEGHLSVFLTGLCKWIIGLSVAQNPPSKVEVKSTIGYKVNGECEHDDLVSIALKFTPTFTPAADAMNLAGNGAQALNEGELAKKVLDRVVTKRVKADQVLIESDEIREKMLKESSDLLEMARYDVSAYMEWAN